jgi:hypothetical protein
MQHTPHGIAHAKRKLEQLFFKAQAREMPAFLYVVDGLRVRLADATHKIRGHWQIKFRLAARGRGNFLTTSKFPLKF